jgi:hypothetical protein
MITEELFKQWVGREPQDDDLDRCNCSKAGQAGHGQCGWNNKQNLPVFMVGSEEV